MAFDGIRPASPGCSAGLGSAIRGRRCSPRCRCTSTCSTCCGPTAATCAPGRCWSARPCCATCCRSVTAALHRASGQRRRGVLHRSVPPGLGGAHRQARRRALPARPQPGLAEVQVPERPGVRHRRLHRPEEIPGRVRRAAARLLRQRRQAALRGQGRHRLRPAYADQPARGLAALSGRTRPSSPSAACPDPRCIGSSPSSSPRSGSASGPRTGSCGTPDSRACAGTRTPPSRARTAMRGTPAGESTGVAPMS